MIERAAEVLARSERIVTFSGAGLSAESGIPTFRDAASGGLWSRYDPMKLASPEGFEEAPDLVLEWYTWRRRCLSEAEPNPAHHAMARRRDVAHVTQNVDDLLERAGAGDVVHLHGMMARDRCHAGCGFDRTVDLTAPEIPGPCPRCGAPLRPAVVWFGETLPPDAWRHAEDACSGCDALLVIGTSAAVYPAAGLIGVAKANGASIIVVNTQASEASGMADVEVLGPAGEVVPRLLEQS